VSDRRLRRGRPEDVSEVSRHEGRTWSVHRRSDAVDVIWIDLNAHAAGDREYWVPQRGEVCKRFYARYSRIHLVGISCLPIRIASLLLVFEALLCCVGVTIERA